MKCKGILIVEDDADIRFNLREVLKMEGYVVIEASNGQEALNVLASLPLGQLPGCILLDLMMPVMDGPAFYNVLKRDHAETWGQIPVIIASAKGSLPSSNLLSRVVERLRKPIDLEQLLSVVAKHCGSPS